MILELSKEFIELLNSVKNKRARYVIDKILEQGYCSTEDLKDAGYEHAPRAARDVRELGIPLETFKMKDRNGKSIAAYRFGDWEKAKQKNQISRVGGRTQLTEKLKKALIARYRSKCNLYGEEYPERLLQPDHRIPYEIGGDPQDMMDTDCFMLLCPSANRDKSWACEHCQNWILKNPNMCKECYYAFPEKYNHIAGKEERQLNIVFKDDEIGIYNELLEVASFENVTTEALVKRLLSYVNKIKK